jgi:hypothetical protein
LQSDICSDGNRARDWLALGGWRHAGSDAKRGRPPQGLAGDYLKTALQGLPCSIEELREAISAGRHRTGEQQLFRDVLSIFIAHQEPRRRALADLLHCNPSTISRLNQGGVELLAEIRDQLEESSDKLDLILSALNLDPVREAEIALEAELEDAA